MLFIKLKSFLAFTSKIITHLTYMSIHISPNNQLMHFMFYKPDKYGTKRIEVHTLMMYHIERNKISLLI